MSKNIPAANFHIYFDANSGHIISTIPFIFSLYFLFSFFKMKQYIFYLFQMKRY